MTYEGFPQVKTETGKNLQKRSGMHTGSVNAKISINQMVDTMDKVHSTMMSMMRMMSHNAGIMNCTSNMGHMIMNKGMK